MSGLIAALERQARTNAAKIALRSRDRSVTFAELAEAVRQGMSQLQSMQVETLGLFLDNGIDWIVYDLAALANGIRVVPLPPFFSDAQIAHAISDANCDAILFDLALPRSVSAAGIALPGISDSRLQRIRIAPADGGIGRPAGQSPAALKISYTSGTTGAPRGVQLCLDSIEQTTASLCAAIGDLELEAHLSLLPYATLLENIAGVYVPLTLGRCVHAEPAADIGLTAALGLDPCKFRDCLNRVRPNSLIVTPRLLELLCQLAQSAAFDPGCLRFVAVGGARVAPALLRRARAAGIPAYEGYGLTEFTSVATLNTPQNDRVGSVGKALPGVTVTIADDGEICLSQERTRGRPSLVRSGDLGRIDDDGFVHVDGRKSNLIVLANGRNVAPEWIEAELDASLSIEQSYVYSVDDQHLAALLASPATNVEIEAEIERINHQLPAYARLHQWHRLATPFSREGQTLTANGRLRRQQIAKRLPALLAQQKSSAPVGGAAATNSFQESNPC